MLSHSRVTPMQPVNNKPVGPSEATLREAEPTQTPEDRLMWALAREVGTTAQQMMGEEIVPFDLWPFARQGEALYASRVAVRWNDARVRDHCRLHCRIALALTKYERRYQDLHPIQQNAINREVDAVLHNFTGRLLDYHFAFLGMDLVRELSPERKAVQS